jgi:thioesterase domain-containing protein
MINDIIPLLMSASSFRPTFDSLQELSDQPRLASLASGPGLPELVCIPSFANGLGPHQFSRFAKVFDGGRAVSAISLPGFGEKALLPASLSLAVDAIIEAISQTMADKPFVLVGYSTGGYLAYAVAEALQDKGRAPAGVVLLDTYQLDESARLFPTIMSRLLDGDHAQMLIDDDHLVAMGAYTRLVGEGVPSTVEAPSLLVQAGERLSDRTRDEGWRATDSTTEVAGNHFTMIEEHAESTARAVETWLSTIAQPRVSV